MKHLKIACLLFAMSTPIAAQTADELVENIVTHHILPRYETLAKETQTLAEAAETDCDAASRPLRTAYGAAFDAWISASHLRFGPTEEADRGFALAFWPDSRGATPKALGALIAAQDPIAQSLQAYGEVSIAARGFYALEFLLYDTQVSTAGPEAYRCTLVRTITADIAATAAEVDHAWRHDHAEHLTAPSANGPYRSDEEALQVIFKALTTGLQFTSDARLGRPLGTFERPHPKRAEAWRSGRSARNVALSLASLRDLAVRLAGGDAELAARLGTSFDHVQRDLVALEDPIFAGVAEPQSRFRIEAVQQSVDDIRDLVAARLGPRLGVSAGFNALDGD
ncbi:MAG: imelysin family protein [Roseovarius sp.]|nr:imelysin family protein [Roseovarius sp.]